MARRVGQDTSCVDDAAEDDDTPQTAQVHPAVPLSGRACSGDPDLLRFTVAAGERIELLVTHTVSAGEADPLSTSFVREGVVCDQNEGWLNFDVASDPGDGHDHAVTGSSSLSPAHAPQRREGDRPRLPPSDGR